MSDGPAADADADDPHQDADDRAHDDEARREEVAEHLADVPDGSGCTRVWETLAERRADDEETEAD